MNELSYSTIILILIVVIVVLTRKLRRFKRGTCSKTEFHIGEGITFSHTSCVNPEPEEPRAKPPVTLYSIPQQPINAICPTCNPLLTQMDGVVWRNGHIGAIVGDETVLLKQRYRAMSEQYMLLLSLRTAQAKAEWQNVATLVEEVRRESDFSQTIQSQLSAIKQAQSILK